MWDKLFHRTNAKMEPKMPKLVLEFNDNNTKQNYRIIDMEGRGSPRDMILEHIVGYDTLGQPVWGPATSFDEKAGNISVKKHSFQSLLYALSYFHRQLTEKPKIG